VRTSTVGPLSLSIICLSLSFVGHAHAQQKGDVGRQIERQLLNNLSNAITPQPNAPYQNQPLNPYQAQQGYAPQPRYQPQAAPGYYPQGGGYQQPQPGYYSQQQPQENPYLQRQPQQGYYPQQPQQGYYPQRQPQYPAAARRYQLPAHYAGTAPGMIIPYGAANYVVNTDGTMSPYGGSVVR